MLLHETMTTVALDRTSLPQSSLDITNRVRTNPFPWRGQFSPQLVEALLTAFAPRNSCILDPFVGSGTSLVEAARFGLTAFGGEINPAAIILARVYSLINLEADKRQVVLLELQEKIFDLVDSSHGPLFSHSERESPDRTDLESALVRLTHETRSTAAGVLAAALVVLCDFHRKHLGADTILKNWLRLRKTVRKLPESSRPIAVYHSDARSLPIESHSIDLVVTSPPYINVHNYHQKFRRSVEALAWDVLGVCRIGLVSLSNVDNIRPL